MKRLAFVAFALAACVAARAFNWDFEAPTYAGSAGGTMATGQDGWYNPVTGSTDASIYTYAGNALGFSGNPFGAEQFIGGMSAGTPGFVRAQHDVAFTGVDDWTVTFDFNGKLNAQPPANDNLGSFSLQPSTTNNAFQTIYQWGTNTVLADKYNANIGVATAAGGALSFLSPGAAWVDLVPNHWYRQSVSWNFASNRILATTLQDLTAGGPLNTFNPTDWYLSGGANNTLGLARPTAVRYFVGGNVAGNAMGFDNLNIVPEPATMVILGAGLAFMARRRKR